MKKKTILITGAAGFIGAAISIRLLEDDFNVIGVDNLNNYYDIKYKKERLKSLKKYKKFNFFKVDISDKKDIKKVFALTSPQIVIHLAAQAGVRYSLVNPEAYFESNLSGFFNILENVKGFDCERLIFASSSSVYGNSSETPYHINLNTDKPVSLYAATKKSNEVLAYSYNNIYKIPMVGLRFFTVYGPLGRPDMAYFKFTDMIASGKEITIFNHGKMSRDMTYIEDIVDGIYSSIELKEFESESNFQIFNLGNNSPVSTMDLLSYIENSLGKKAKYKFEESEIEVKTTWADISQSKKYLNYDPKTSFQDGMDKFLNWYKSKFL
tara:strand:+ start:7294 stop:8265 length:972 start_codon:yes stop_codon:yes gene_type:complete